MDTPAEACHRPQPTSRLALWALGIALIFGVLVRYVWIMDMEFKGDEQFLYEQSQLVGVTQPWPELGMVSGVGTKQPALCTWILPILQRVFRFTDPTGAARAIQSMNILALFLFAAFAWRRIPREDREVWIWGVALGAVNPMAVILQRKIWSHSALPLFSFLAMAAWWRLDRWWGAFVFGLLGILIGQVHMSGFFFLAAVLIWSALYRRKEWRWGFTAAGLALGSIPMIPWLKYMLTSSPPVDHTVWIPGYFYRLWGTGAVGLDLRCSIHSVLRNFLTTPEIGGQKTYLALLVFAATAVLGIWIVGRAIRLKWKSRGAVRRPLSNSVILQCAGFWGYGLILTALRIPLHQHYLIVAFPLMYVWFAQQALHPVPWTPAQEPLARTRTGLAAVLALQMALTVFFLNYIHVNHGAPTSDYGVTYGAQEIARKFSPDRFR